MPALAARDSYHSAECSFKVLLGCTVGGQSPGEIANGVERPAMKSPAMQVIVTSTDAYS